MRSLVVTNVLLNQMIWYFLFLSKILNSSFELKKLILRENYSHNKSIQLE